MSSKQVRSFATNVIDFADDLGTGADAGDQKALEWHANKKDAPGGDQVLTEKGTVLFHFMKKKKEKAVLYFPNDRAMERAK